MPPTGTISKGDVLLLQLPEVFAFKSPKRDADGAYRVASWQESFWCGSLRIIRGSKPRIDLLEEVSASGKSASDGSKSTGSLFASCPLVGDESVANAQTKSYARDAGVLFVVRDSSRFFVLAISDGGSRVTRLGIGFASRDAALDFKAALADLRNELRSEDDIPAIPTDELQQIIVPSPSRKGSPKNLIVRIPFPESTKTCSFDGEKENPINSDRRTRTRSNKKKKKHKFNSTGSNRLIDIGNENTVVEHGDLLSLDVPSNAAIASSAEGPAFPENSQSIGEDRFSTINFQSLRKGSESLATSALDMTIPEFPANISSGNSSARAGGGTTAMNSAKTVDLPSPAELAEGAQTLPTYCDSTETGGAIVTHASNERAAQSYGSPPVVNPSKSLFATEKTVFSKSPFAEFESLRGTMKGQKAEAEEVQPQEQFVFDDVLTNVADFLAAWGDRIVLPLSADNPFAQQLAKTRPVSDHYSSRLESKKKSKAKKQSNSRSSKTTVNDTDCILSDSNPFIKASH